LSLHSAHILIQTIQHRYQHERLFRLALAQSDYRHGISVAELKVFFQLGDDYANLHTIFENAIFEKAFCFTEFVDVLRALARLCLNVAYVCWK